MVSKVSGFISQNTAEFSNYSRKSISHSHWVKIAKISMDVNSLA